MPGILSSLLGEHFEKERKKREAQIQTYGPIAHDYLTKSDSAINPDVGEYAVDSVTKLLPKKEQERFKAWADTLRHGRELAGRQQQLNDANQGTPRFVSAMAAPQAEAVPPPPTVDPGMSSPILSMNAPQMAPPPGNPPQPLPGSSAGQPGNGAEPIVPSDPTTPGNPSQGFTSLGVTPGTTTPPPPPSEPLLRYGTFGARTPYGQALQAQPAELLKAQTAQQVYETRFGYLRKQGLNDTQIVNILGGHPGAYEPVHVLKPGEELYGAGGKPLATSQQPRLENTAAGGQLTAFPVVGRPSPGGVPPPPGTPTTVAAPPPMLGKTALAAKQAYIALQKKDNPSYEWTDADLPKAIALEKESSMSPTEILQKNLAMQNLREVQAMRRLSEQNLNLHMQEFRQTKGPEAIDAMADQIYSNPETVKKLTGDMYNLVAQQYKQKYGMPMPRELNTTSQDKDDASKLSFNHVQGLRELLKNPVIQKRMGAFSGREGELEQMFGDTVGLSKADATAIQEFRTRLPYLFGQEARAIMGRPAQKFMDELKAASPSMKMGLPLFTGALNAVEAMAKTNILTAEEARNGVATPRATPPPGKIEVKRKSDGRMGFMDEHDFNPTLYEKVNAR